jgi:hypothetical protein
MNFHFLYRAAMAHSDALGTLGTYLKETQASEKSCILCRATLSFGPACPILLGDEERYFCIMGAPK